MGKKSWFSAMKKAIRPSCSKINKGKRSQKSKSNPKNSWYRNQSSSQTEAALANPFYQYDHPREFQLPENEQIKHVDSITYTTNTAQDTTSHAAPEVHLITTTNSCFLGKTREEIGAIKIQAAYRGYMARRAFRSLRAMLRLNLWIQGQAVKHQTASNLIRIQTMSRVQSQVRARRIRVAQVNETVERQLIRKHEKVLEKQGFDLSPKSKEQVDAMLKGRKEAAERRKKALAYAFSRQETWRNSQKAKLAESNRIDWRWSWSNRWCAIRPWDTHEPSGQRSKSTNSKPIRKHSISVKSR